MTAVQMGRSLAIRHQREEIASLLAAQFRTGGA